jgi:hypothetical protein
MIDNNRPITVIIYPYKFTIKHEVINGKKSYFTVLYNDALHLAIAEDFECIV